MAEQMSRVVCGISAAACRARHDAADPAVPLHHQPPDENQFDGEDAGDDERGLPGAATSEGIEDGALPWPGNHAQLPLRRGGTVHRIVTATGLVLNDGDDQTGVEHR